MSGTSIQIEGRKVVFQIFCGRWETANILDHHGRVLRQLLDYDWDGLRRKLGLTHVYLLGLWDVEGPIVVNEEQGLDLHSHEHRCPSPFAITNHAKVSSALGTAEDLCALIRCLHDNQLHVFVDFVPNHTGTAHSWVVEHPDYYKLDDFGKPKKAFSGDVFELNYDKSALCDEMMNILSHLFGDFPIDGVRCDMAHLIPASFWKLAIGRLRQNNPNRAFIAEAYSDSVFDLSPQQELVAAGFDAVYDEPLFRNARSTVSTQSIKHLFGHIQYELSQFDPHWIHYVSNHDDSSWCGDDLTWKYQQLFFLLGGLQLIYNGTPWGFEGRLAHHWIQLLPQKFYDPGMLSSERTAWLEWYVSEQPVMTTFDSLTDNSVNISWQGRASKGVQGYTFS